MEDGRYDRTFCILSVFAIVMVVAGHAGYGIMTVGDLFPYYSFHIPLFMFISGYFYRDSEEEHPLLYVKKKVRRLLWPYLVWNLLYGLLAWALRCAGFSMGESVNLKTLFLDPFLHGYQYLYNYAAWFVPTLFVVEMMNLLARLLLRRLIELWNRRKTDENRAACGRAAEWIMLLGSLFVGMAVVQLSIGGHVWGPYRTPGRILFLFPCFQMGRFYHSELEKRDTIGNLPYFAVVLGIQALLGVCCGGLAFSSVWCSGFANGPVIPYVTSVSGIAFWLRAARVLTPVLGESRALRFLGRNTYAVMMHHVLAFMLVKAVLAGAAAVTGLCADFDFAQFYGNIDYLYLVRGAEQFKAVYLAAGLLLPLGLQYGLNRIGNRFAIRR